MMIRNDRWQNLRLKGIRDEHTSEYSVVWMEKLIANRPEMPEPFVPFVKINKEK
jgi:hypothetical protein